MSHKAEEILKDKDVLMSVLAHMRYSFGEIDWSFDKLTLKEKSLIKSQAVMDKIKLAATLKVDK